MQRPLIEIFQSWVEAYLLSLRFLEKLEKQGTIIPSTVVEELEMQLQKMFDSEKQQAEANREIVLGDLFELLVHGKVDFNNQ